MCVLRTTKEVNKSSIHINDYQYEVEGAVGVLIYLKTNHK